MKEKMKKIRFPLLVIIGLAALAIIAYGGANTFREQKMTETVQTDMSGVVIETSFGILTLKHANSTTTLDGSLTRSTPCVDWNVAPKKLDTGISIDIRDANKDEICVQSLGTPQVINTTIDGTVPETAYMVNFEGTTVFQGSLKPIVLPATPIGGTAQ